MKPTSVMLLAVAALTGNLTPHAGSQIHTNVAQTPLIAGKNALRKAYAPKGELLLAEQRRARTGQTTADLETRLALAEYHPFWYVEQISQKTAVLFVITGKDARVNNETDAVAASKLLKGQTDVVSVSGMAFNQAANAAVDWFLKYL